MSTVLFLGFNDAEIQTWLHKPGIVKVVVFDNSYENRENFEKLYKQYGLDDTNSVKLTMYEGCIERNINTYLQKEEVLNSKHIYSGNSELLFLCKNNDNKNECCL
jgi:hypothetical protein